MTPRAICSVPKCDREPRCRGFCSTHYTQWYNGYSIRPSTVGDERASGVVYFLAEPPERGRTRQIYIKVGYSGDYDTLGDRLKSHQSGNPRHLILLAIMERASLSNEAEVHRLWTHWRARGHAEWFLVPIKTAEALTNKGKIKGLPDALIRALEAL